MTNEQREALRAAMERIQAFNEYCEANEYTDTGEAWTILGEAHDAIEALFTPTKEREPVAYYVLHIWGDVEPQLHGPFDCEADRDSVAKSVRAADEDDIPGGIYPAEIDKHGALQVDTYSGAFFDEE